VNGEISEYGPSEDDARIWSAFLRYSLGSAAAVALLSVAFGAYKYGQSVEKEDTRLHEESTGIQLALRELEHRIAKIEAWKATSAKLRLFFPELTETDVATLHESETVLVPFHAAPKKATFERELSPAMSAQNVVSQSGPFSRYFSAPNAELEVDYSLPAPELLIDQSDPLYPTVRMTGDFPFQNARADSGRFYA